MRPMNIFIKAKFLFLLLFVFTSVSNVLAQVVITRPTGGQNISNDLSYLATGTPAPSPGYTPIGNIVIAETAPGDFTAGTNRTLTFDRPSTAWQFNAGVGTAVGNGPNISNVSVTSVTTSRVTVRYTVTGTTNGTNSITISGLEVQSLSRTLGTEVFIFRSGGSGTINGLVGGSATTGAKVAPLSKKAGAPVSLQVLLPGQSNAPGGATGKSGTVVNQVAGAVFPVVVNAVDYAFNISTEAPNHSIELSSTNPYLKVAAGPQDLSSGSTTFNVSLNTAGGTTNYTITATDVTDASISQNISSNIRTSAGPFKKLLVIFPGEALDSGSPTGKTGTASAPKAGIAYVATVYAVDDHWNRVASSNNVTISASGVTNATQPAAVNLTNSTTSGRNFNFTFRTSGEIPNITAVNNTDGTKSSYNQVLPAVVSGAFVKLQLLLPGETAAPGTSTGKTGTPTARVAGVPFNVTVNAVDASWNVVNAVSDVVGFTATNDAYAQLPTGLAFVNGTLTTSVTYRLGSTSVNRSLRVDDVTDNIKTSNQSPSFAVNVGPFSRLLVILPGETYVAGHPNGKTGTPSNQGTGAPFNITVRATDEGYNTVTGITDVIKITSSDVAAVLPPDAALANGVKTNFSVRLNTISNSNTLTATDITDGAKTPYTTAGIPVLVPSATTDYFRSVVTGTWTTSSTWESSANGSSGWQPATLTPTNTSAGVTVRNGHVISVAANLTIDDVVVESGGQLTLTGGTLTIANGAAPIDFNVQGVLRNNGRPMTTTGVLQVANGGSYQHNFTTTSGTIPTATWATGSVCEIVGYTNLAVDVAGTNQTFSDFVWNTTALTGSPTLLSGFAARNFTVTSTGTSGTLYLAATGGTTSITGNYKQTAGNVIANKTSGTHNLTFAGNVAVNGGSFGLGNGTVNINFNGASQSIVNSGSTIAFQNVNFSNGGTKTLTSGSFSLATTGVLTMGASTTLNANGNLTLLSDASSSATIANIPSSSAITGNVTVQRFISGGTASHRTYRMLSSPVYDNGNSGNRQYSFAQFADDMIVSGSGAGFYPTPNNAASAWTYDGTLSGDKYVPIPNVNTSIPVGQGAYLFYRGDKVNNLASKVSAPYAIPESFPMTFTGVLNQQNVGLSLTTGFNLVGNPYASSIDWNTIAKTNLQNNTIRIWNPSSRSYASYNGDTGVPSGMNNIIPAGQGFFVQSNAGGSLSFTESSKVSSQPSSLLMSSPLNEDLMANEVLSANGKVMVGGNGGNLLVAPRTELRIALKKADLSYEIETAVVLQEGRDAAYSSGDDVNYITASGDEGTQVFFSTLSNDNRKLTINYLPEVSASATVKLDLDTRNAAGDYTLHINTIKDIPAGYIAKLNDALLGTSTVVQNGDIYPFTINANNAASAGANRFSVSFEAPVTLPVDLSVFAVAKTNQGVAVKWSTKREVNNDRFELERAGENGVYTKIYTEYAKGSGYSYNYLDRAPLLGNNYYRLVQFDLDGKKTISEPKVINYSNEIGNAEGLAIYPNPVKDKFILKFNGVLQSNSQTVRVISSLGQIVLTKAVSKADLLAGHEFVAEGISSGVYVVEILDNGNQKNGQLKMIKQ